MVCRWILLSVPVVVSAFAWAETPAARPLPWAGVDVGKVGLAGRFERDGGRFTLFGAGGGVYTHGDAFYYAYVPLEGDGQITARTVSMKNSSPNTSFGFMARETLEYDAKDTFFFFRPNRGYIAAFQARFTDDIESVKTVAKESGVALPHWLRMQRTGNRFSAFLSRDGVQWRPLGSAEVKMSRVIALGLFLCSYKTNLLSEVAFDHVSVSGRTVSQERYQQEMKAVQKRRLKPRPRDPRLNEFDALAALRRVERPSLPFGTGKKLISANVHSMPPPSEFVTHLKEYEKRPFNGVVLTLQGGERPFRRKPWDEARFLEDYRALASLKSEKLTDNFLVLQTSGTMDWFDDQQWKSVLLNTRLLAKAALIGRCAGFFVDPEGYGSNAWSYYDAFGRETKDFVAMSAQVRERGEEWIRAIEEELPAPRLLFAFLMPNTRLTYDPDWPIERIRKDLPRMRYGLLPSFINGILRAAGPNVRLIGGNESAYYYRRSESYRIFARYVREVLPKAFIDPDLREKYKRRIEIGSSLYPNYLFALHPRTLSRQMTPVERARWFEHNTYWALKTSDEYVWDWLERPGNLWVLGDKWAEKGHLPRGYLQAIQSAHEKLARGAPLGFGSAVLFDAVRARAAERRPRAEFPRLAPGMAPVIDGNLNEPIWQRACTLSNFIPLLAWAQTVQMKTRTRACFSTEALYVAFDCQEDRPAGMRTRTSGPDDLFLVRDDNVQIFIIDPADARRIYRFCLNPRGKMHDVLARQNPDAKWRDRWPFVMDPRALTTSWQAATRLAVDSWTAEVRIPWKELGIEPRPGLELRINFSRYRTQGLKGDRTSWAPILELQGDWFEKLDPELFGTVTLR